MYEYIFLYALAFFAILFAVVQDFRFREISNWVTFSLVAFVLAYRLAYSVFIHDFSFFLFGLGGVLLFTAFGYALYYGRVFAGGDAKLLFGLGGILPYSSLLDYVSYGLGFILLLLISGVAYTLVYSVFIAFRNWSSFVNSFKINYSKNKLTFLLLVALFFIVLLMKFWLNIVPYWFSFVFPFMFFIFIYARSLEQSCMIKLTEPEKLTEGDWLVSDIRIGKNIIRKTVHGLSYSDIILLRKYGKKVLIKNGIPFAPAFLIALIFSFFFIDKFF